VDEIEAAGQLPPRVHARQAKRMLGMGTKTDTLDARGLNRLQRTGTLPPGWIPPGALRDQRALPRTRLVLTRERTRLKHRIHATLAQDGFRLEGASALVGRRGRAWCPAALPGLPPHRRDHDGAPP
jgi:transposase